MRVLRDLVLIRADKPKDKTDSGILIVEEWHSLPPTGTVLAVGPKVEEVVVGDRVMFERYGSIIVNNDERLCQEKHIMGVFDEDV